MCDNKKNLFNRTEEIGDTSMSGSSEGMIRHPGFCRNYDSGSKSGIDNSKRKRNDQTASKKNLEQRWLLYEKVLRKNKKNF